MFFSAHRSTEDQCEWSVMCLSTLVYCVGKSTKKSTLCFVTMTSKMCQTELLRHSDPPAHKAIELQHPCGNYLRNKSHQSAGCLCCSWSIHWPHHAGWSTFSCRWFLLWWWSHLAGRPRNAVWSAWTWQSLDLRWRREAWRRPAYDSWSWWSPAGEKKAIKVSANIRHWHSCHRRGAQYCQYNCINVITGRT